MVKLKTYTVKCRKDGCSWKDSGVKLYATSWHEAKGKLTEWVIGWLDNVNKSTAIEECAQLRQDYLSGKYIDTYRYDTNTYTIKAV